MNITLTFAELSKYISEHYGKTLTFGRVSEKEVCVSYSQKMFFKTIQVPVNITIDEVEDDAICVTYNGGFGIDMIIAGALSFLKSKLPELTNVIVSKEGHQLSIELAQLSKTKALVENLRLNDILICDNHFEISASLK